MLRILTRAVREGVGRLLRSFLLGENNFAPSGGKGKGFSKRLSHGMFEKEPKIILQGIKSFDERACSQGSVGKILATQVMLLAMSHAGKLTKFGP